MTLARALGLLTFSLVVAGAGSIGEDGSDMKGCFSCDVVLELLEDVEETERLVFRRSLIFTIVCIDHSSEPRIFYFASGARLSVRYYNASLPSIRR